jgi:hypothetical protein
VVAADQAAKASSTHATQAIDVPQAPQKVQITSAEPSAPVVGGATYTLTAEPGVAGPPAFTASGACTVAGDTVTIVHAAACTVTASWSGDHDYLDAQDSQTFQVGKGEQSITFTSNPPATARVNDTYPISATSSSGAAVTFSTSSNACSVSGSTVTFVAPGACVVDANAPATDDYNPAPQVSQSVTVTDEVSAVMSVTATADVLHGHGQQRATAVVTGLPPGSTATLTVTVPSAAHITTADTACAEQATIGGQTFVCTVTTDPESFVFDATINKGRPIMTFHLTPVAPLVLAPGSQPDFQLALGDTAPLARRNFAPRVQG